MIVPNAKYPFRHRLSVQTRFNDYDILGHLNNTVYPVLADIGKTAYFTEAAPDLWNDKKIGMVIASIKCDFHAPALPGESLDVLTAIDTIGTKSFVIEQRIVCPEQNDAVKCIISTVMVHIDIKTLTATDVPDAWIAALNAYEGRKLR